LRQRQLLGAERDLALLAAFFAVVALSDAAAPRFPPFAPDANFLAGPFSFCWPERPPDANFLASLLIIWSLTLSAQGAHGWRLPAKRVKAHTSSAL
jgi:hypothetical protein